ncbi:MAG: helix-turn-helix transcriptional regulator, partial [Moorella sp. (in: Bacteria)]|nr:helix-turn-helix transcriptional regulator [Moorella sp. (in: firmicutes)]
METLEGRLRKLREKRGLKQKEVAALLNLNPNTLSRYESGERTPDPQTLVKLANFYGVTTDYLLTGKTNGNGHSQPWWERDEPPDDIELWDFVKEQANLRLMGNPLDEEAKEDILLFLRAAHEH